MIPDTELLQRYAQDRDERAFGELVQRHLDLVYSAALRRTRGRTDLAGEIAQKVFTDLARKAASLARHPALAGWLHRSTRYAAIDAARAELRIRKLRQSLAAMPDSFSSSEPCIDWEQLRPVIDEAMDQLTVRDREVVLLRFFNGLTFPEVGARLHLAENAARMRTDRAMYKLRRHLARRGVTSTASALGLLLANQTLTAAPAGLAAAVTAAGVAMPPAVAISSTLSLLFMSKITAPLISAALAAGLTALLWTSIAPGVSARELARLRQENTRLAQAAEANASPSLVASIKAGFASQATAISRAVDQQRTSRAEASAATAPSSSTAEAPADSRPNASHHRNRGQATPHDAFMSFWWADDAGEIAALSKLIYFEEKDREKAREVLASMPESLRAQYPTPEELYAFFFTADTLVAPLPGPDVFEPFEAFPLGDGRIALRRPNTTFNAYVFQQTPEGWKWVVPEGGVEHAPDVLNNETLAKLGTR